LIRLRLFLYQRGILQSLQVEVPVIIVGNLTVGGTGKTPITLWIANSLRQRGFRPGIVSRGYGGSKSAQPILAQADSDPALTGDEAVLMANNTECPIAVHPDRVAAIERLCELGVNVIVADDGLQHYRLGRNYEIAVIDGARGIGNGRLLPAGPLREPEARLRSVDQVLIHGDWQCQGPMPSAAMSFQLQASSVKSIDHSQTKSLADFSNTTVHAVAGIGNPDRFFDMLRSHGLNIIEHAHRDHSFYTAEDFEFGDDLPVLMTEKDMVKCRQIQIKHGWYVPVSILVEEVEFSTWLEHLEHCLAQLKSMNGISYR
jgi:tetraacyldisaccharide 4'-kinase